MISGGHSVIYCVDPEADRAFFRDALKTANVDADDGWLIFALPPPEVAIRPAEASGKEHQFYFLCNDVDEFNSRMTENDVTCSPVYEEPWRRLTEITLLGGGRVGVYQPLHERPPAD